jgi:N6-adenosine-specific RNA methylase IME4
MKTYDIILADPPWHFKNYSADKPGKLNGRSRGAAKHYPTMATDDICKLSVPAADDAVLFLWACWPNMLDALEVIDAWGFTYKTLAWVWIKSNPSGMGFFMGNGYYTRSNSEPCLLATRGRALPVAVHDVMSIIMAPVQEHSRKPAEQFDKIERLYPGRSYLEMFARRNRAQWDVFGNEVEGSISIEALHG